MEGYERTVVLWNDILHIFEHKNSRKYNMKVKIR
jgi:hypothetical protein